MRWLDLPPVWLLAFLVLAWTQSTYLPLVAFGAWADWLGWTLVLAAVALMAAAVAGFARHRTTVMPRGHPTAVIRTGVYRVSRNPIYLADALALAGFSLVWSSLLGLALVPVFVLIIERRFIRGEEARLRDTFGEVYHDYCEKTRRWI
ncbi:methyltransferase family protein [Tranquillimonas alkanivorans]|uniref:Protein-S-isoprenylcysteine O-methyltransferase Ste14 n=1 Tax=Tranquillimonas alkanivorans TaxID=441119 RepID=A0A1I5SPD8_9RHOB|nr:isoprenylcysteine carboxylmethyltransferase family protein [Tranquillimonas alkanivorans]SFP72579.1 Protein-S-isoprenylcysteine O-methyltransferase Ste14 [Tranquillimonas alkanivorans]